VLLLLLRVKSKEKGLAANRWASST
jgi:hypothetical protein